MGLVYFFGGIAKLNSDWLEGWPLRIWMPRELNLPVLWRFRDQVWLALAFSYSGLLAGSAGRAPASVAAHTALHVRGAGAVSSDQFQSVRHRESSRGSPRP